jgi:hypothetical protein
VGARTLHLHESIQWSVYLPYDVARGVQCTTLADTAALGRTSTVEISTFRAAIDHAPMRGIPTPERGACIAEIWRMHIRASGAACSNSVGRPAARGVCTTPW